MASTLAICSSFNRTEICWFLGINSRRIGKCKTPARISQKQQEQTISAGARDLRHILHTCQRKYRRTKKKFWEPKCLHLSRFAEKRVLWRRSIAASPFTEQFAQIILGNQRNANTQHNSKNDIPSTSKY